MARRTIIEIAERVGVSPATVSRALNNLPGVSADKRHRILAVAAELDYHPNAIARRLQGRRTNTVAYAVSVRDRPSADLFFFKDFITALAERCAHYGLDLLLHPVMMHATTMEGISKIVRSGRADGLILTDIRHGDQRVRYLAEHQLPFVAFGRSNLELDHSYVDVDGEWGVYTATGHLIQCGHRRIAFLGLPVEYSCAIHRRDGYLRALRAHGLACDLALVAEGLTNETDVRAAMERLLVSPAAPTAFVAASDMLAIHAMNVADRHGLRAGRDYAIVGFDDLPLAAHTNPPLTTVRQPLDRVCDELITLLTRLLSAKGGVRHTILRPELIVRESSALEVRE